MGLKIFSNMKQTQALTKSKKWFNQIVKIALNIMI